MLKFQNMSQPLQSHTYSPMLHSPAIGADGLGWLTLSQKKCPQQHIRCHKPQSSNEQARLQNLISKFQAENAVAVIVINTADNFNHSMSLSTPVEIPVVCVTASVGARIQETLQQLTEGKVFCKLNPKSPVAAQVNTTLSKGMYIMQYYHSA